MNQKGEQAPQTTDRSRSFKARLHIFAYISASIFLYIEGGRLTNVFIQAVGAAFLAPAFLILMGQLPISILKKIAKFTDGIFSFALYIVVIAIFIKEVSDWINLTKQVELLWAIPVVLVAFIIYDIIDLIKDARIMARSIGKKTVAIRYLKLLSFILGFFVLLMLGFDVQGIGKPIYYLAPSVVALLISLFLDGTLRR